jgi:hypothetical protein
MTAPTPPTPGGDTGGGGGGDPLAQFQGDLDRLADLSDDELRALEQSITDAFDAADSGGDDSSAAALADALDQVRNEIAQRSEAPPATPVAASVDSPDGPAENTDPPAAENPAPGQTSPDAPPPAETAEGQPQTQPSDSSPSDQGETTPVTTTTVEVTEPQVPEGREPVLASSSFQTAIVAGAAIQGMDSGQQFKDLAELSKKMSLRVQQLQSTGGDGEHVLVASVRADIPEDKFLRYGDPIRNREKIDALTHLDAITAAGGCCAPLETRYGLFQIGDTDRPVKGSLAGAGADRGGIRFFEGPTLDAIGAAVGFWTCADDAAVSAADPATWKVCARVDCPDESESLVQAVTLCLTFGVMQSRVFPEMVTANNNLALVAQARLAESSLLAQIKAQSNNVGGGTVETGLSFLRTLLDTVDRAQAYFRSRHRIARSVPLRATFPVWFLDAVDADLVRQPPSTAQMADNFGMSQDQVMSFFRDRNINVTWTLDTPVPGTNGGGAYAPLPTTGTRNLPGFPANMEWSLSMEGSFLFLDGGQLDLGIVRDSTLVRTNDYQTFTETFESVARIGGEALWVTTPVATTGRFSGPLQAGAAA